MANVGMSTGQLGEEFDKDMSFKLNVSQFRRKKLLESMMSESKEKKEKGYKKEERANRREGSKRARDRSKKEKREWRMTKTRNEQIAESRGGERTQLI